MSARADVREWIREAAAAIDAIYGPQAQLPKEAPDVIAAVNDLLHRERFQFLELDHLRQTRDRLIALLAAIHMRCAPDDVTLPDGRVMRFVPPDPEMYWRELSGKVRAIESEMRAINEADITALARVGGTP